MLLGDSLALTAPGSLGSNRERSDPVLSAFFSAHEDPPPLEIVVFKLLSAIVQEPQACPVRKEGHEGYDSIEAFHGSLDFSARKNLWNSDRPVGPDQILEPGQVERQEILKRNSRAAKAWL